MVVGLIYGTTTNLYSIERTPKRGAIINWKIKNTLTNKFFSSR